MTPCPHGGSNPGHAVKSQLIYCRKRCTLVHELIHWQHADATRDGVYGPRLERRTRRETPLKLVNPLEYQTAEVMYEGDHYRIACELDVTLQIIQDHQRILDSSRMHCKARSQSP